MSAQAAHIDLMLNNFSDFKNCNKLQAYVLTLKHSCSCMSDYNYTPVKIFGGLKVLIPETSLITSLYM